MGIYIMVIINSVLGCIMVEFGEYWIAYLNLCGVICGVAESVIMEINKWK